MKLWIWFKSHFEVFHAILIAVVSLSTAFAVWRTNIIGSNAADAGRLGLIDAVKQQGFANENYRKVYEEAGFAYQLAVKQAEAEALAAGDDAAARDRAANIEEYLLPSLQLLGSPLTTDEKYQNADGTYNLQSRLRDLESDEQRALDPAGLFDRANSLYSQQRWLMIGSILLAISLFFLTLAEISNGSLRTVSFTTGLASYFTGILWFFAVEIIFLAVRRGGS
jgi:hypothetical protein